MSNQTFLWADANCNGKTELFYSVKFREIEQAETLCSTCPRLKECKVLAKNERHGVWAGTYRSHMTTSVRRYRAWKKLAADEENQWMIEAEKLGLDVDAVRSTIGL